MDPEKVLTLLAEHATQFAATTVSTLARPVSRFETVSVPEGTSELVRLHDNNHQRWLSPKLITYAVLSIVLGMSINALIPDRTPPPELLASVVLMLTCWFILGSFLHLLCRLMRGTGRYVDSLSVTLQIFGAVYVVTSFLGLAAAIVSRQPLVASAIRRIPLAGGMLVSDPGLLFFPILTVLLMVYLPLALLSLHGLGGVWARSLVVALMLASLAAVAVGLAAYLELGVMMYSTRFGN